MSRLALLADTEMALPPATYEQLARIRGAMWTARLQGLPYGPRPFAADNCICIDYFEAYNDEQRNRIIQAYVKDRGYTHAPMGPMVDPGYHGQLPTSDYRKDAAPYFTAARQLEWAGCRVVHFVRPDRGTAGLDWTTDDLDRELGPVFSRYRDMMRIVCLGWEPGPQYYYDNAWWVSMCQWMARTFPNAIRLIHMTSDTDAPVGGDDDKKGITNGQGWANVAPYIHGFLAQYGGYVSGVDPVPSQQFIANFLAALQDLKHRFETGGPDGTWPTSSAWGKGRPIRVYAGEYAAYGDYWKNFPEDQSQMLGQLALSIGADGFFDGGR